MTLTPHGMSDLENGTSETTPGAAAAPTAAPAPDTSASAGESVRPLRVEDALERYASEPEPQEEPPPHHSHAQPRDAQGRFGDSDVDAEPPSAEGEPPADGADTSPSADGDGDGEADSSAEGDAFVLALPGRRAGEPDVEVELSGVDQFTRERLAQMRNGFIRGEEYRAGMTEVENARDELLDIQADLAEDPAGFFLEKVHPSFLLDVVKVALARLYGEDATATEIANLLNGWEDDPASRESFLRQQADAARQRTTERPSPDVRRKSRALNTAIANLIPEGTAEPEARSFFAAGVAAVQQHILANQLDDLDVAEVPRVLSRLLTGYGYTAPGPQAGTHPGTAIRSPAAPPAGRGPASSDGALDTGTKLVKASARRREMTGVTPGGPVAATAQAAPPQGQTVEQRLDWFASRP